MSRVGLVLVVAAAVQLWCQCLTSSWTQRHNNIVRGPRFHKAILQTYKARAITSKAVATLSAVFALVSKYFNPSSAAKA
jgi:hypothetical protein